MSSVYGVSLKIIETSKEKDAADQGDLYIEKEKIASWYASKNSEAKYCFEVMPGYSMEKLEKAIADRSAGEIATLDGLLSYLLELGKIENNFVDGRKRGYPGYCVFCNRRDHVGWYVSFSWFSLTPEQAKKRLGEKAVHEAKASLHGDTRMHFWFFKSLADFKIGAGKRIPVDEIRI